MKKYRVKVNGSIYEIELEEVKGATNTEKPEKPQPAPQKPVSGDGEAVLSPMPGNILSVNVSEGAEVKKGDLLMVLEAMKMENEIMAPTSGTVTGVIPKGSVVETGTVLCTIK